MRPHTVIDAAFTITGTSLPLDHGYPLFGALSRIVPALHEKPHWGVHPILGLRRGPGVLALTKHSWLKLRLPVEEVAQLMPLAGLTLDVDGHPISLGVPRLLPLVPAPALKARFVTVKKFHDDDPAPFVDALRRQLAALEDLGQEPGRIEIVVGDGSRDRRHQRVIRIGNHKIVGYPVSLANLDARASLAIQARGLGGRRHMGGGMFVPYGKGQP